MLLKLILLTCANTWYKATRPMRGCGIDQKPPSIHKIITTRAQIIPIHLAAKADSTAIAGAANPVIATTVIMRQS